MPSFLTSQLPLTTEPVTPPLVVVLDMDSAEIEAPILTTAIPGVRIEAVGVRSERDALTHPLVPVADVVIVWHTVVVSRALLTAMTHARAIIRVGVGYDNVDVVAAASFGIPVANIPHYGTEEVADHTLCLILCLLRRTVWTAAAAAAGEAAHGSEGVARIAAGTRRLRGLTLGILGCGRIGTATALRAKAFGLDVVFYDPNVPAGVEKALGIRRVATSDELAAQSHVLSVHCDLNPTSRGLVNVGLLERMPRGGFLVNTARGGIVVEADAAHLLHNGHLAGAAIDVHEREPFIGTDETQPLAGVPHCLCTPHTAFYSDESYVEMRQLAATAAVHALTGVPLSNVVNARSVLQAGARVPVIAPRDL